MMRVKITIGLILLINMVLAQSATNFWQDVAETDIVLPRASAKEIKATAYRTMVLNAEGLQAQLRRAPMEFTRAAEQRPLLIELPLPDGTMENFALAESPVMAPGLAARYPDIKTYKGHSIRYPSVVARVGYTPEQGLHAVIISEQGQVYIDPLAAGQNQYYQVYYTRYALKDEAIAQRTCGVADLPEAEASETHVLNDPLLLPRSRNPVSLRTYRIAIATSGEFARRFSAFTRAQVLVTVVNVLNRANAVFETDAAIRLVLAENNDAVLFLDPETDPFTEGSVVMTSYMQVPAILDANIGAANYDVGHALIAGCGSGVIGIGGGRACNNTGMNNGTYKGFGISCIFNVNTSSIEVFAHELGHQFSAGHTWSNCPGNQGQLSSASAFEPGGGSTIMSYTNACEDQTIQNNADAYFHTKSIQDITNYSRTGAGAGCAVVVPTQNVDPEVRLNYRNGFHIPISTPFELTATATDANGDQLTYCWEQFDLGPLSQLGNPMGNAPSFRSFPPTTSPTRVFPRLQNIINNVSTNVEVLPTYDRTLTFRCTVRDNRPGGGAAVWQQVQFRSTSSAGPFLVLHPNEDTVKWTAGTYAEVRWDVARTNNNLVNCQAVNIRLSLDGGLTYPITLASATLNTGSARVPVPNVATERARVRVEAADNIFFDISNQNFEIRAAVQAGYTLSIAPLSVQRHCLPAPLQFNINSAAFLGFNSPLSLEVIANFPPEVSATLSRTTILPSESATLTVAFSRQLEGNFNFQVRATAANGQIITIPVTFSTISNDFSALRMLAPTNGQTGIILSTTFSWNRVSAAARYDFELATSPAFGANVIASARALTDTFFTPTVFFDENRLYFWRIRPYNDDCNNLGEFLEPFAFHTATVRCEQTQSANVPINISGSGLPTINSVLNVTRQGTINDVNIPLIRANYQPVRSLRVSLISPAGTEVTLYDQNCGNTLRFETGFDDESPTAITNVAAACPPDRRLVMRPVQPLAAFKGENMAGTWTLRIRVVAPGFGGGGGLDSWGIEFCSAFTPQNPFLVKNDTLFVPPGRTNTYTVSQLEVRDNDNPPAELTYILVTPPRHGTLLLSNMPLEAGGVFTQADVNNFRLQYRHNGSNTVFDHFTFVVQDGAGGFLPTQRANIRIDANATVDADDLLVDNNVRVFPNPASNLVYVQFNSAPAGQLLVSLYNLQGQELQQQRFEQAGNQVQIDTTGLPGGMYILTLRTHGSVLSRKISIQR